MMSKVGNPQIYEDHEQRYVPPQPSISNIPTDTLEPHCAGGHRTSKQTDHNLPKKHVPDQWHIDIDQLCVSVSSRSVACARTDLSVLLCDDRNEREIGERMAEAHQRSREMAHGQGTMSPGADPKVDPLGPATFHGNEPSMGAKIDAEIMAEEREELKRKHKA